MHNLKQKGIIMTIIGLVVFFFSAYDLFGNKNFQIEITVTGLLLGIVAAFIGPALALFPLSLERRKKIANRIFLFSFFLLGFGLLSGFMHWLGANVEVVLGSLIFCFLYGTLALKNKYEKWEVYTRSKRDALFLSLFDFIGIASLALGFLFRVMHWPWAEGMALIGLSVLGVGMIAWNNKFKKEVIFRKETEDKLKDSFDKIEIQKHTLEEKQKEIIDSINYAKRIQTSRMATEKYIEQTLNRLRKK
jgi:hypothetical protein